ncbi:GGDEF domain-containing protein [Thioalkalivibrio denitrificans]|uniref:diguanylate cyclase n=1 Tax=Thioalkalivibrio denitrificans TaxID=108003 RepID=A0A1V3N831_9GAMM|nr:GGDEF domain-containing protein [Thioalkalivibrio denitrificans]
MEPDRLRLARFSVDAVRALGGSVFGASVALTPMLARLRNAAAETPGVLEVSLRVDDTEVRWHWPNEGHLLARLPSAPPVERLRELAAELSRTSESADPELLRRRNEQFAAELEQARQRAAHEMAELEADLDRKKRELQASIRKAETDSLTGLLNRGAYDNRLREAVLRASRQGEPLCLILLDLDFFKEINDSHGHQYGDQYLQRMASVMRASIREHVDKVCRVGGDEFAIIAWGSSGAAQAIADRVLVGMDGKVSIGVTQLRKEDTLDTFVGRADAALYDAKRRGRGRVSLARGGPMVMPAGNA